MIKIFHIYGNNINLGDWGSALGIQRLLNSVTGEKIQFTEWHTSYEQNKIDEDLVLKINKEYNAVVIGGGGLYIAKEPKSSWPLGFLINISRKNLERIKVPIIIFSVGLNQNLDEKKKMFQKNYDGIYFYKNQIENIRLLNDISTLVSVRDFGTKSFLENIGCTKKIFIAPCPSMFLIQDEKSNQQNENEKSIIGLNLRNGISNTMVNRINQIVEILKYSGFDIVFISHNSKKGEGVDDLIKSLGLKTIISENPIELMENYKKLDFTIGMRGHSNIFSFGANKPFISLSYNVKTNFFAEMVNMNDFIISSNGTWSTDDFIHITLNMVENATEIKNQFKKLKDKFNIMDINFAKKVIKTIN